MSWLSSLLSRLFRSQGDDPYAETIIPATSAPPILRGPLPEELLQPLPAPPASDSPRYVDGSRPVPEAVVAMTAYFEAFRSTPYRPTTNPDEPWTYGYGTTRDPHRNPVTPSTPAINDALARQLLMRDLEDAAWSVKRAVTVPLSDGEFGALVSFVHNIGPGKKGVKDGLVELKSGGQSTLLKRINAGEYLAAAEQFPLWSKAGGVSLLGLRRRRAAERAMFLGGAWKDAIAAVK